MNGKLTVSLIEVGLLVNYGNVLVKSVTFAETNAKKKRKKKKILFAVKIESSYFPKPQSIKNICQTF